MLIFVSKLFMTNKVSLLNSRHCYFSKETAMKSFYRVFLHIDHVLIFFYRYFAQEIDLSGLQVDMALRKFQSHFRMPVSSLLLFIDTNRETLVHIPPPHSKKKGVEGRETNPNHHETFIEHHLSIR